MLVNWPRLRKCEELERSADVRHHEEIVKIEPSA